MVFLFLHCLKKCTRVHSQYCSGGSFFSEMYQGTLFVDSGSQKIYQGGLVLVYIQCTPSCPSSKFLFTIIIYVSNTAYGIIVSFFSLVIYVAGSWSFLDTLVQSAQILSLFCASARFLGIITTVLLPLDYEFLLVAIIWDSLISGGLTLILCYLLLCRMVIQ